MMTRLDDKVELILFHPDDDWQHVAIGVQVTCRNCKMKPCLTVCPSGVFQWNYASSAPILVLYKQCLECGACRLACPENNIKFSFPNGGYGVMFREG